jgi:hypothetical protein
MLRLVLLGMLFVLVVQIVRGLLTSLIAGLRRTDDEKVAGKPKDREIDLSNVKDADFRDIDE